MLELPEWSSKKSGRKTRPADQWTHSVFKHDVPGEWPHRRPAVNRGVRLARLAAQPALWALAALTVTNSKVCIQTPIAMHSSMSPALPTSTQLGQLMTALTSFFFPLFLSRYQQNEGLCFSKKYSTIIQILDHTADSVGLSSVFATLATKRRGNYFVMNNLWLNCST